MGEIMSVFIEDSVLSVPWVARCWSGMNELSS